MPLSIILVGLHFNEERDRTDTLTSSSIILVGLHFTCYILLLDLHVTIIRLVCCNGMLLLLD